MINFNPESHSLFVTSKSLSSEKLANTDFSQLLDVAMCCAHAGLWGLVMRALSLSAKMQGYHPCQGTSVCSEHL